MTSSESTCDETLPHRHIPLRGTPNFRDLGGYETRCGRRVRFGKVFRSGTLAYLNPHDWRSIADLNIDVICDFRSAGEQQRQPTQLPEYFDVQQIDLAISVGDHHKNLSDIMTSDESDPDFGRRLMHEINELLAVNHYPNFGRLLQAIADLGDQSALLFHCSAGKDRTGLAAALLLSCLNVDREVIEQEYLLSGNYFLPEPGFRYFARMVEPQVLNRETFFPLVEVRLDYIRSAFAAIERNWGSVDQYIEDALELSQDDLARLRASLLE